jgi:Zn-dependent peptidase ImmA (M78 family)/transcriptional regulator with XRE-family HTH domain
VSGDARSAAALFDPGRLRLARQLKGLKRSELAGLVGLSAAAVSQFEGGSAKPRASTLAEIALRLGLPVRFFASTGRPLPVLPADQTFFRSLRRTSQIDRERATAHAVLLLELVRVVESKVTLPAYDVPADLTVSGGESLEEVEGVADRLRGLWGLGCDPIPNAVRLLERHGVVVARLPLLSGDVDAFSSTLTARPVVILGADKGVRERSRRDALHELGHLILHHVDPEAASAVLERQAERFASAMLVPADAFREEWPAGRRIEWPKLVALKGRWGMSMGALLYRARELGLITPTNYESGIKYMSRRGWRVREPGAASPPEEPKLLGDAIRLMGQNAVELDPLLEEDGLPPADLITSMLRVEAAPAPKPLVAV